MVKAMPGGVGIRLSPHHSCFLLLSVYIIKLPYPCTHKPVSQTTLKNLFHTPAPLLFASFILFLFFFCCLHLMAFLILCHKINKYTLINPTKNVYMYMPILCFEQHNMACFKDDWGCCFILIKIPSSFPLPPRVFTCPRSKCQQNLGTRSGIWCHITQRTWIQKTSQHGDLPWSTAKPAATC